MLPTICDGAGIDIWCRYLYLLLVLGQRLVQLSALFSMLLLQLAKFAAKPFNDMGIAATSRKLVPKCRHLLSLVLKLPSEAIALFAQPRYLVR